MCRLAHGLTRRKIIASEMGFDETYFIANCYAPKIQDRDQLNVVLQNSSRKQRLGIHALSSSTTVKLSGDGGHVKTHVEDRKAVWRIPPAAADPCTFS